MRILLTGRTGQLGRELGPTLAALGSVTATDRSELDLRDVGALRSAVGGLEPDVVVNAAAYTDVERAEREPEAAAAVNRRAPGVLAEEAARSDALLVHFSTDYVFSGDREEPYAESDAAEPTNVYGEIKLAGERAVREAGGRHLILRTSGLYGLRGDNILATLLRRLRARERVPVVDDEVTAPTWTRPVAAATAHLLYRSASGGGDVPAGETLHVAAGGEASWLEFARELRRWLVERAEGGSPPADWEPAELVAAASSQTAEDVRRPGYSVLSCERLARRYGLRLPGWQEQLRWCLAAGEEASRTLAGLDPVPSENR